MRFLVHRLLHSIFLLVGISLLSFAFLELAPGNFFDEMRLNPQISHDTLVHLEKQYGLDHSFAERYLAWVRSAVKGDWGVSFAYGSPVAPLIWTRARNTLLLTGLAMLLSWMIALPVGLLGAAERGRWLDNFFSLGTSLLLVTPDLLLALGLLWLALRTHWFPAGGMQSLSSSSAHADKLKDVAFHLMAPVAILVLGGLPVLVRHIRAAAIDALQQPCIRAARSHGISRVRILFRHGLPLAAAPLVSLFGFSLASLLSASLLVEVVMSWPGLGPLLLEAILARDVYLVIGAVMLAALFLAGGMLITDCLLFAADPRIRTEKLA
ncbi:MAG TPA: ABC transporter permease [Candidatus Sulfotelmatobacter sp.]|jgi:peptide/nickel transport system permease protein